ncbi:MAG: purine-nucleoside phosphorylase [Polyangiaceae bacterium]
MSTLDEVLTAAAFVGGRIAEPPRVGVVLGSGLGTWADALDERVAIPYADVPHMPVSKVVGHAGNLVLGRVGPARVACLQGRVHFYEGHSMDRVVFGARLLAKLGCRAVLLTNAAGGIRRGFAPGDLMLLTDHLNLMGTNPLAGPNDERLGPRFPDMTEAYARWIRDAALGAARASGVHLHAGVYAALLGPSYETPAEIQMLRTLGADAVGMSTVPEIIALRHMGVPAGAVSCITNLAAGLSPHTLDHAEVEATARASRSAFVAFLTRWVEAVAASAEEHGAS